MPWSLFAFPVSFAFYSLSTSALSLRKFGVSFCKNCLTFSALQHLLSSPPPIFTSPMDILAVQMPKRLCPLVLRPQRASADRLVGDKSNSVTLVAGVMLRSWRFASSSNRCQHCHCAPSPKPNIPTKVQQGAGGGGEGGEKMGWIWLRGTKRCEGEQGGK